MKSFRKYLTEASQRDETSIELGNTRGVLKLIPGYRGVNLELWAGGSGYDDVWKNPDFAKKFDEYQTSQDIAFKKSFENEYYALRADILKAANMFDKEVEKAMNKHGFRK